MLRHLANSVRNSWTKLSVLTLVCLGTSSALADGVIRDGLGAVSSGRGGTNIAHFDNGQILLDNPAAMLNIEGTGLYEVGVDLLFTDLRYSDPDLVAGTNAALKPMPLGQLAYITKSADGQWAFGLGAFAPAGFAATYHLPGPTGIGGIQKYKSLGALGKILPGVAYRVNDRLSIGGTFGVAISHAELEGPFFIQTGAAAGTPTLLDLQATGAAISWSFGMPYQLSEQTTIGLTYQSETRFHLNGFAYVEIPGFGQSRFDAEVDLDWPQSLGLGLRHELCPHRILSVDVIWFDWSQAFDTLNMKFTNASNDDFTALLGSTIRDQFPLNWSDSVSLRVGYEHFVTPDCVLRAGYTYHPNPIPDNTLTPYIPAILGTLFLSELERSGMISKWTSPTSTRSARIAA